MIRSTWATVRARAGNQDASDSIKALLSRCETEPSWSIYQSSRGKLILFESFVAITWQEENHFAEMFTSVELIFRSEPMEDAVKYF